VPRGAPDGVVYRYFFDQRTDPNQDGWPDGWTRKPGIGFPEYVTTEIVLNETPVNLRAMKIDVAGGNVLLRTPMIPALSGLSYTVKCYVRTEGLVHNNFTVGLTYFDAVGKPIYTETSPPVPKNSRGWYEVELGPIAAESPEIKQVQLSFLLSVGKRQDLSGTVLIAGVELKESPTVFLTLPNKDHIFIEDKDRPEPIEVRCRITGLPSLQEKLSIFLEDPFGRILEQTSFDIRYDDGPDNTFVLSQTGEKPIFQGRGNWTLPIGEPGFYRIRVSTSGLDPKSRSNTTSLVVLRAGRPLPGGDFGWTLPGWSLDEIRDKRHLLSQSGLSWLKFPIWFDSNTSQQDWDKAADLCEWLTRMQNLTLVGLLSEPPQSVLDKITSGRNDAAGIFSLAPQAWFPSLEPTLLRLNLIRYWQLGTDEDRSITEIDSLIPQLEEIRSAINTTAIGASLGFGWDWNNNIPESFDVNRQAAIDEARANSEGAFRIVKNGREFLSLSSDEPLTFPELEEYLQASGDSNCDRFVVLRPISRTFYPLEDRINDLVRRMITGKINDAKTIFIPEPQDDKTGLLNTDGTPGELYLPWRTTALMLSGRKCVGSINLPNGSENLIFEANGTNEGVMVVWNDAASREKPIDEILYLGTNCERVDLWGKRSRPLREGRMQIIPVGPIPTFITGVNGTVTRFRQQFTLDKTVIPSQFGPKIPNGVTFENITDGGIGGTMSLIGPSGWKIEPQSVSLNLAENESVHVPFSTILTPQAQSGPQPFQVAFKLLGAPDGASEFAVYETIRVGAGDVYLEPATTAYNPRTDELTVRIALINDTEKLVSFRCTAVVKGRQPERKQIRDHGFGRYDLAYVYPNGRQLLGRMFTIEAKEIGGTRTLKNSCVGTK
ncbi:MAG: hypothetical protein FWC43_14375, partial [Planctomycetaceae bacterium]|nr:hypothetical protein [Planctomycetaceae bacterium]